MKRRDAESTIVWFFQVMIICLTLPVMVVGSQPQNPTDLFKQEPKQVSELVSFIETVIKDNEKALSKIEEDDSLTFIQKTEKKKVLVAEAQRQINEWAKELQTQIIDLEIQSIYTHGSREVNKSDGTTDRVYTSFTMKPRTSKGDQSPIAFELIVESEDAGLWEKGDNVRVGLLSLKISGVEDLFRSAEEQVTNQLVFYAHCVPMPMREDIEFLRQGGLAPLGINLSKRQNAIDTAYNALALARRQLIAQYGENSHAYSRLLRRLYWNFEKRLTEEMDKGQYVKGVLQVTDVRQSQVEGISEVTFTGIRTIESILRYESRENSRPSLVCLYETDKAEKLTAGQYYRFTAHVYVRVGSQSYTPAQFFWTHHKTPTKDWADSLAPKDIPYSTIHIIQLKMITEAQAPVIDLSATKKEKDTVEQKPETSDQKDNTVDLKDLNNAEADRKLELAEIYIKVNNIKAAREVLENLIRDYPETEAAQKAAEKLKELDKQ